MRITTNMLNANTPDDMVDALNPHDYNHFPGRELPRGGHDGTVLDAVESALLYALGRISKQDFLDAFADAEDGALV